MKDLAIVLTAVADEAEGRKIARRLIDERLAACVQILPEMTSIYVWDGKVEEEAERLLLIKTTPALWTKVESAITELHSYETPEIVMLDSLRTSESYAKWLLDSIG